MREAFEKLREKDREITRLGYALATIEWDLETKAPEKGAEERGAELSMLSMMIHDASTAEEMYSAADAIEDADLRNDAERALVRNWRKDLREEKNVPSELVGRIGYLQGAAHAKWVEARKKNDFSLFAPILKDLIDAVREKALLIAPEADPYDTLLDEFEPGMSKAVLDPLFGDLEKELHRLMDEYAPKCAHLDTSFLRRGYDRNGMESFCRYIMEKMGFDFERGTYAESAHPFTTTLGPDDIRITNRFTDEGLFDPIGSVTHETGHALYEQNAALNPEIRGTSLSGGVSMGIHESQSRFWENFMGRTRAFWEFMYPEAQKRFPSLEGISLDEFLLAVNKTEPSAIRVNADELTYSLHIILRYRMEKGIFDGSIKVEDIPSEWNRMSEEIIRYTPKTDSEGCLQDSHWAGGMFGYFPTYALGNLYAAMWREQLIDDLGGEEKLDEVLSSGNFTPITYWQKDNIWYKGGIYLPKDLLFKVTGKSLDMRPFVEYLEEKYSRLYK